MTLTIDRNYNVAQRDFKDHILAGSVPMLWGPGGIGKSAMAREVANDLTAETGNHWGFIDARPSLRESVDFRGIPVPDLKAGKTRWLQPDDFPREDRDGKYGIWLFDEISACTIPVQVALYQLIWDRALGDYRMPDGWQIGCAGNRLQDKAGAMRMSTALNNRVAHIDVDVDSLAWCDWGVINGIHPMVIAYHRWNKGEWLFKFDSGAREYPSPRSWTMANRYAGIADRARRMRLMSQLIGQAAVTDFESFIDIAMTLEPIPVILANPMTARIPDPDKIAAAYAVTCALANNVTRETAGAGADYVMRLPSPDLRALYAQIVMARDPALASRGMSKLIAGL